MLHKLQGSNLPQQRLKLIQPMTMSVGVYDKPAKPGLCRLCFNHRRLLSNIPDSRDASYSVVAYMSQAEIRPPPHDIHSVVANRMQSITVLNSQLESALTGKLAEWFQV